MDENPKKLEDIREYRDEKGRFIPGVAQPGAGRPKGSVSIVALIRNELNENPDRAKSIAEKILARAETDSDGKEFQYIREILERIDGKVTEKVEQSVTVADLSEFTAEELQAFRDMLKERKDAQSK